MNTEKIFKKIIKSNKRLRKILNKPIDISKIKRQNLQSLINRICYYMNHYSKSGSTEISNNDLEKLIFYIEVLRGDHKLSQEEILKKIS